MDRKLINFCEVFSKGKQFDLSLYDDNGNTCYSAGTLHVTPDDVISIKNLLDVSDTGPYTYHLNDINYLCVKSSDNIVLGRGGFNQQTDFNENKTRVIDVTDVTINTNGGKDKNAMDSVSDLCKNDRENIVNGTEKDSSSAPEAIEKKVVEDRLDTTVDIKQENASHDTQTIAAIDHSKKGRNERIGNAKRSAFAAMEVKSYIVLVHGLHNGKDSWITLMKKLKKQIIKYLK